MLTGQKTKPDQAQIFNQFFFYFQIYQKLKDDAIRSFLLLRQPSNWNSCCWNRWNCKFLIALVYNKFNLQSCLDSGHPWYNSNLRITSRI